jgi:hypothetical protein
MDPSHRGKQQTRLLPLYKLDIESCLSHLTGHPRNDDILIPCIQEYQRWAPLNPCRTSERE